MIDRLFLATLTFCMLTAGTLAIASEFIDSHRAPVRTIQLERVVITAKRLAPPAAVAATERLEPSAQRAQ